MKITMNTLDGVTLKTKNKYVNEDIAVAVDQAVVDEIYQDGFQEGVASVPPNKLPSLIDGSLTEITAEDLKGATKIKDYAFAYVTGLTSVTIPNTVTSLGYRAFYYSPIEVNWEDNPIITEIGNNAFEYYLGTVLIIPSSVTTISKYGIYRCYNITNLEIPNNVTTINEYGIYYNDKLTSITIPNSVTSIGNYAFAQNNKLTTVTFAENSQLKTLGLGSFQNCSKLESIALPNELTIIQSQTFQNCNALSRVTISPNTTGIGSSAFQNCTSLTEFEIPSRVNSLNPYVFYSCSKLTNLTIPANVTIINSNALQIGSSTNKATITFLHTTPPSIQSNTFNASYLEKIVVPLGYGDTYKNATNWSNFADYIVESDT